MITICIVDSSLDFRESVGLLLESYGYEIWLAAEGAEALAMLDTHERQPSIILYEVEQAEVAQAFTDAVRTRDASITVIYVLMVGLRVHIAEMTAENVLTKPFAPEELINLVERELHQWHPNQGAGV